MSHWISTPSAPVRRRWVLDRPPEHLLVRSCRRPPPRLYMAVPADKRAPAGARLLLPAPPAAVAGGTSSKRLRDAVPPDGLPLGVGRRCVWRAYSPPTPVVPSPWWRDTLDDVTDLEQVRARALAASAGPWQRHGSDVWTPDSSTPLFTGRDGSAETRQQADADAEFVAHVRQDVLDLLALLDQR